MSASSTIPAGSSNGTGHGSKPLSDRAAVLVLVGVALVMGLPLITGRVLAGQDIVNYLIHAQQTAANMRELTFLPSWGGGYNAGFGSPVLLFFPPFTSVIHAVPVLLGTPVISSVSLLAILGHLLSGIVVFKWLRSDHPVVPALAAALVYMVAPYRPIDLYFRSALAEHWAFLWPPIILWASGGSRLLPTTRVFVVAGAVAGLLLTNTPQAILFGSALAVWLVVSETIRGRRLQILAGAGLGFVLASVTLVPQALAGSLLDLDLCFGAQSRFPPSESTLFSGGFAEWTNNTMFSLGVVASLAIVLLAYGLLPAAARRVRVTRVAAILSVVSVAATTPVAGWFWDAAPIFSNIQFPWRIASILTLVAAVLVADLSPSRSLLVMVLTGLLALPFLSWNRTLPKASFSSPEPRVQDPGASFPDRRVAWEAGSGGWYWRHETLSELCLVPKGAPLFFFAEFQGGYPPELDAIRNRPAAVLGEPNDGLTVLSWGQKKRTLEVEAKTGGTLVWRVIPFPEMVAEVDGRVVEHFTDPGSGLFAHDVPPGRHVVEWTWRPFPALWWARLMTLGGLVCWIAVGAAGFLTRRGAALPGD